MAQTWKIVRSILTTTFREFPFLCTEWNPWMHSVRQGFLKQRYRARVKNIYDQAERLNRLHSPHLPICIHPGSINNYREK